MKGSTYKRCKCRDDSGKEIGAACPRLRRADGAWNPKHGAWYFRLELPVAEGERRQVMKRGGFDSQKKAEAARDAVDRLLAIPERGRAGASARAEITAMVEASLRRR